MPAGKLGALAPHPEDTHPRVKLANHMNAAKTAPDAGRRRLRLKGPVVAHVPE